MDKLNIKHFSELTSSELHHISGGNWWSDWFNKLIHKDNQKRTDGIGKHKIG